MTSSIKLHANGDVVVEARDRTNGGIIGTAGPGKNTESDWIAVPTDGVSVSERTATEDEIAASHKTAKKDAGGAGDGKPKQ